MIARLRGTLESASAESAIIDVAGVGYRVLASSRTLAALGPPGSEVIVHTEMLVSDDAIRLIGFASGSERDWFLMLNSVQGVGSRVALAILSALEPAELHRAIASGDQAMVTRAQGVGPKLAQRIVNELKDKTGEIGTVGVATAPLSGAAGVAADAISALIGLGFRQGEAATAVRGAIEAAGEDAPLDQIVRASLKLVAR